MTPAAAPADSAADRAPEFSVTLRHLSSSLMATAMVSVLMLKDAAGNEFKTSNSPVIASVIDEMKRTLDSKVREIENQINL